VTWAQLQAHRPGRKYPRHPTTENAYKTVTNTTGQIRVDVLGWKWGSDKKAYRPTAGWRKTAVTPNKYPYWTEPGVHHWLLWSETPMTAATVQKRLARDLPPHTEYTWFINPEHLRSVPGILHVHVFWR
jgi:hypothetical protein